MKDIVPYLEGVSVLEAALAVALFLQTMLFFFMVRNRIGRRLDIAALVTFAIYWIGTLVFAESVKWKWYISLLMLSIVLVRIIVTRKKLRSP